MWMVMMMVDFCDDDGDVFGYQKRKQGGQDHNDDGS